ncbi:MAG: NADH-quinone oxidoreductase subunit M [Nitrospirae bacterium]|nr:NADH-quinone oxidoreductase subunit M [Nitrospirota bacterium]MCK6492865.1 NADH-quinone oxidoreductase subunit M [Nitrospira sp.]MCK6499915.1 NADH-quinone oxidoreductase subunit M [Nitrospira sp.]MEB2339117.1 NADH-quinone oxidoreductase subunit M [Nitrospirales bacterium]
MSAFPWLSLIVFVPLLGALICLFVKAESARWVALGFTLADLVISLPLWWLFDPSTAAMQFVERASWITSPPVQYSLGLDGISFPLVLMTTVLMPFCVTVSWSAIEQRVPLFMSMLLVMETAMLGVFVALDFILFYVFWEAMLIPMYLLIGVWGGPNRLYAAIKFFLYTLAGSVLLLVAILVLYFQGGHTFDILALSRGSYSATLQMWLFLAFFAAFAVKVPMFPFHTWLPDAHVEAPTAGSVILASVLLKMGTYGFLRFSLPMLPDATVLFTKPMIALSIIAIIYGAYMALAQADMKKLIAYSSVSHMGFVTLGIFVLNIQGIEGAVMQMINHGITTGGLFLCVGIIYERTHSRQIMDNTGLAGPMPRYAVFLMIFALSSLGLPGTNSFVGEFLVLAGTFVWSKGATALAALGVILSAAYILWLTQRVVFGTPAPAHRAHLLDLNARETATLIPLIVLVFVIGIFPNPLLSRMHASVTQLLAGQKAPAVATQATPAPGQPRPATASLATAFSASPSNQAVTK